MKKKFFALLMALCMVFSMTTVALADEIVQDGSMSNPYQMDYNDEESNWSESIELAVAADVYYALTTPETETGYGTLTVTFNSSINATTENESHYVSVMDSSENGFDLEL